MTGGQRSYGQGKEYRWFIGLIARSLKFSTINLSKNSIPERSGMSITSIRIEVPGIPRTAGSKRAMKHKWTGKIIVKDDNKKGGTWRTDVQVYAKAAMNGEPLFSGALDVTFWFILPRPKSHFGRKGNVLNSAPKYPAVKPDVLKMARAAEDALTTVCWTDDALIVDEFLHKRYAVDGRAGCIIEIRAME